MATNVELLTRIVHQAGGNPAWKSLENALRGQIRITGDIVHFNTSDDWEAFQPTAPLPAKRPKRGPRGE